MDHEHLQPNRRPEATDPNVGFSSSLVGRPIVRAVALLLTLDLSGCFAPGRWAPLGPGAELLPDRIHIRGPASDAFPRGRELDLLRPRVEGDSVLVGTQGGLRGDELLDAEGRPVVLRFPVEEVELAGPRELSVWRTTFLVLGLAAPAGGPAP